MKNILFVNCKGEECGVYQYGYNFFQTIKNIPKLILNYVKCDNQGELINHISQHKPEIIIYNYHQSLMPFINKKLLNQLYGPIHVCLAHELSEGNIKTLDGSFFHYYLFGDPSLEETNPCVFKIQRIIPAYENKLEMPSIPTFGSFGFGNKVKGYDALIERVQEEFDEAVININISPNSFFDPEGNIAKKRSKALAKLIKKPQIKLNITHDFLTNKQLLDFLAANSMNVFMYEPSQKNHGISSSVDFALAVSRPFAITKNTLFRHLFHLKPSIVVDFKNSILKKTLKFFSSKTKYNTLKQILENGLQPFSSIYKTWTIEKFQADFIRIITTIRSQAAAPPRQFNCILDDAARKKYKNTIETMFQYCPEMMRRKIPKANVQQAFVLDTVRALASPGSSILSVGSFEDTACETLIKMGYSVEFIDPEINFDLDGFFKLAKKNGKSYDIIFSTSVIEHVENDKLFIKQMEGLLNKNGIGVITCDFKDDWKPEEGIFSGSFRFYTQDYLNNVLIKELKHSKLIDQPQWNCPCPDFEYSGKKYTFATIVFQKS